MTVFCLHYKIHQSYYIMIGLHQSEQRGWCPETASTGRFAQAAEPEILGRAKFHMSSLISFRSQCFVFKSFYFSDTAFSRSLATWPKQAPSPYVVLLRLDIFMTDALQNRAARSDLLCSCYYTVRYSIYLNYISVPFKYDTNGHVLIASNL